MINIDSKKLSSMMREVLESYGVVPDSFNACVDSLIQTSLRGVDSHGIHLFPHYCRAVQSGRINKSPHFNFTSEGQTSAILDADHAFGHHSGLYAMKYSIEKAKKCGIAATGVINSTHFGAASFFALEAAKKDCIGFSFTNADALVKAHNSTEAFFGTNPICFTAPLKNEDPFCLDMATSTVSWNKIKNYRKSETKLESGWAFDENGKEVINPEEAKSLSPIGSYKGFGLGMMVDILCSALIGGITSKDLLPMFTSPIEARRNISHFFMVLDISKFRDISGFKEQLQSIVDRIRKLKHEENQMMVAGDPQKGSYKIRINNGIPISDDYWGEFLSIDNSFHSCVIEK